MASSYIWLTLSIIAYGLWAFFPKLAVQQTNVAFAMLCQGIGNLTIGAVMIFFQGKRIEFSLSGASFAYLMGMCGGLGTLFFMKSMENSQLPLSIVTVVSAAYPVVTTALAVLFLGEKLSLNMLLGVVFAIMAAAFFSQGH